MPELMCDICGVRPASIRVSVLRNGSRQQLDVCDYHYAQLSRHQRYVSPFESLFDRPSRMPETEGEAMRHPLRRGRTLSQLDETRIEQHFSEQAKEILQRAAERALQSGKREVDTEHLLYELCDSDVVQALLSHFKITTDGLRDYIDENATKSEQAKPGHHVDIGVSPRVKGALDRAFIISKELGHSYIGPRTSASRSGSHRGQLRGRIACQIRTHGTGIAPGSGPRRGQRRRGRPRRDPEQHAEAGRGRS
jgi:ATP-dependent Clp protease ATP-binding subunit ClpC